jgi:hypothetical protein
MYHQMSPQQLLAEAERMDAESRKATTRSGLLRQLASVRQQEQQLVQSLSIEGMPMEGPGAAPGPSSAEAPQENVGGTPAGPPLEPALDAWMGAFAPNRMVSSQPSQ